MATMYGDPGTGLADIIQSRKANKEQSFYNSLLSYGMEAGGEFEIVNDTPVFTPGGDMPTKSAMWNQLLQAKGGRLSAADIQQFESAWKQANQMKTSKQLQGLNKLALRGYSPDEVKQTIEDSPVLYNNLLDLVGNLESSGDDNAFEQAQVVKGMLPEVDRGGIVGEMYRDPGIMARLGVPAAALGVAYGASRMLPGQNVIQHQRDVIRDMRTNRTQRRALGHQIKRAENFIKTKPDTKFISTAKNKLADYKAQAKVLDDRHSSLLSSKKDLTRMTGVKSLHGKYQRLGGFGKTAVGMGGYYGLSQLGALGEALGGETGRDVGETAGSAGLLGWGLSGLKGLRAAPHPYLKALGYAPLAAQGAYQLYNRYK
jgi:hypothetical protein